MSFGNISLSILYAVKHGNRERVQRRGIRGKRGDWEIESCKALIIVIVESGYNLL